MGSIMDQERPWKKPGYVEPRPLSAKEEMRLLEERLLKAATSPNKWTLFSDRKHIKK